jgi:hypothetical protein
MAGIRQVNAIYNLAVTDPEIEKCCIPRASGDYTFPAGDVFLTISLSEVLNNYCYKLPINL